MPLDQHAGVLLPFGQAQDLPANPGGLIELGLENVVAGQAPEHWEQLRQFASLERLEGGRVGLFDLAGVPLGRQQRPGQADPQRDLLRRPIRS